MVNFKNGGESSYAVFRLIVQTSSYCSVSQRKLHTWRWEKENSKSKANMV